MSVEAAVFQHLSEDSAITALVPSTRMFQDTEEPAEPVRPFLLFALDGTDPINHFGGQTGLFQSSVDIQVFADSSTGARTVATLIRARFEGFSGNMGASQQLSVRDARLEDDRSGSQKARDGGTDVYRTVGLSFNLWYEE